jgi:hypothetical protein
MDIFPLRVIFPQTSNLVAHDPVGFRLGRQSKHFVLPPMHARALPTLALRPAIRASCANGSGLCRRYAGHFDAHWFDYKVGRVRPVRLSTRELVIEDRCPHTRAAMIEFYASKLGAMESFHRMTHP